MRTRAIFLLLALGLTAAAAAQAASPLALSAQAANTGSAQRPAARTALDNVTRYLTQTRTLRADFVQYAPNGTTSRGTMLLARPGKVRFDYAGNAAYLVVADGSNLHLVDYELAQVQRWPIGETPLAGLLEDPGALIARARLVDAATLPGGLLAIEAADSKHPEYGKITLFFEDEPGAPGGVQLTGWSVVDAQNQITQVRLANLQRNVAITDSAFRFRDPRGRQFGPRR